MRRPHRTIETFDISLMAVVTKAMGAFLVLMLLLLPYYTPEPREDDAAELLRQLKAMNARLDEVAKQLGDPNKGPAELRKDLGKISVDATIRAEVIAKLEGLIHKAFSEVRRLEAEVAQLEAEIAKLKDENKRLRDENTALVAENEKLRSKIATLEAENKRLRKENAALEAENKKLKDAVAALEAENQELRAKIAALLRRIAELEAELERLRKNEPRKEYRAVMAGYNVANCTDVVIDGFILKVGAEKDFTWEKDNAKVAPELLFQATYGMNGGSVPGQEQIKHGQYPKNSAFQRFDPQSNAGMLADMKIGQGDYAIILIKKDRRKSYEVSGRSWRLLTTSRDRCHVRVDAAARPKFTGDWTSGTSVATTMVYKAIGGIVLAFTSDDKGISFRAPTDSEQQWFEKLLALAIKTQDEIPEIKKEREERERKAREAAEKRRREAEEKRKRLEEIREKHRKELSRDGLSTSHISPRDLRELDVLEQRLKEVPEGERKHLEKLVMELRQRVKLQIKETQEQLSKMHGPMRARAEMFLQELRKYGSEQ